MLSYQETYNRLASVRGNLWLAGLASYSSFEGAVITYDVEGTPIYTTPYAKQITETTASYVFDNTDNTGLGWTDIRGGVEFVGVALGSAYLGGLGAESLGAGGAAASEATATTTVAATEVSSAGLSELGAGFALAPEAGAGLSTGLAETGGVTVSSITSATVGDALPSWLSDLLPQSVSGASLSSLAGGVGEKIYRGTGSSIPKPPFNANLAKSGPQTVDASVFGLSMPVLIGIVIALFLGILFLRR